MTEQPEILFDIRGRIGFVTLNRPQALNALTFNMVRLLDGKLIEWAEDPAVRAVAITGAGDRAFCAGGDVKAVALESKAAREGKSDGALMRDFFRREYTLNHRIYNFPKPYIALVDGIVMGGGKGVSAHGSQRVVTEKTLFAMPEAGIGFFPDVGGGYFLPRCPGQTGAYLALTAKRIGPEDTLYIGFATHFVHTEKLGRFVEDLVRMDWDNPVPPRSQVDSLLTGFQGTPPGISELALHRERIDRCFAHDRVEDIVADLEKDKTEWAQETLKAMSLLSPTSLKVALRQIRLGAHMTFAEVMTMEYRLSQACLQAPDFYEGIRAALIDKDRQPKWQPGRLGEVLDAEVENYFRSLGSQDLVF